MEKLKWDCHDWRDWVDSQSTDSVVTELQCQYNELTTLTAENAGLWERLGEADGLLNKITLAFETCLNESPKPESALWLCFLGGEWNLYDLLRAYSTPPTSAPEPGEPCKECKGTGKINAWLHEGVKVIGCPTCKGTGLKIGENMTLDEALAYHKAKRETMVAPKPGAMVICQQCKGTGRVPCPYCAPGLHFLECSACDGTGTIKAILAAKATEGE